jgi:hypothetical protein
MATQDELDALHRVANIPASDATYTDTLLASYIDSSSSIEAAAARIWRERAALLAGMVDTTESGSSRKLSDLHKNALGMAAGLDGVDVVTRTGRSFTTPIERQ